MPYCFQFELRVSRTEKFIPGTPSTARWKSGADAVRPPPMIPPCELPS